MALSGSKFLTTPRRCTDSITAPIASSCVSTNASNCAVVTTSNEGPGYPPMIKLETNPNCSSTRRKLLYSASES